MHMDMYAGVCYRQIFCVQLTIGTKTLVVSHMIKLDSLSTVPTFDLFFIDQFTTSIFITDF